jgi:hypothetical protein
MSDIIGAYSGLHNAGSARRLLHVALGEQRGDGVLLFPSES